MADNGVVAGGRLTDWVSLGVLAAFVPRDAVDDAIAATGKQAKRSDGKLPPHVVMYLVMALALFADEDYEEVAARLTETLTAWGCWDDSWSVPTSGGITQARQRLGYEPVKELFAEVAVPVAEEETAGAFLGPWRLMAIDGFEWDAPDTKENVAVFGLPRRQRGEPADVPQGAGGEHQRVRLACDGEGGDGRGGGQGCRGAVAGPRALPAAGRGLAADRRPELLQLGRLVHRRRFRRSAAVAGQG